MSLTLRDATPDDAPAIKRVLDEHALASFGEIELNEEEIRSWFELPRLWVQLAERDGEAVGYLDVATEESGHIAVDARTVDPEAAPVLVAAAEVHAREAVDAPVLRGFVQGDEPELRSAFEAAGWSPIRHSFQMRIDLDHDIPPPGWPAGLVLRNAREGEEERVYEAHMDSFQDHWDFRRQRFEDWKRYATGGNRHDLSLWWLVEDGDELAGLSLNAWHFSGDPQFGWVHVLGVRPPWRKRGLGTALLRHSFRDFASRGATRVGLGVDGENTTGAVRLYERVGMRVVRRNDTYEKTL
ncbi:MAG: GNAT family N-acetyltransferase [Gaiellaceae bacterium]